MRNFMLVSAAAGLVSASPVERIVDLLKELKAKSISDHEAEQQVYDKYACWCEKTTDRKADAIEQAKQDIATLGTKKLTLMGKIATRAANIAEATDKINKNIAAQKDATDDRMKENADFKQEKAEAASALATLEKGIAVLSGAGTTAKLSLLQRKMTSDERNMIEMAYDMAGVKSSHEKVFKAFIQGKSTYAPQSATIVGILKDLYATFAKNLENASHTELSAVNSYEEFMDNKKEQLATQQEILKRNEDEKAELEVSEAETTEELNLTTKQMNDDVEFFDLTKETCKKKSAEWGLRTSERDQEITAIEKTIDILDSESSKDAFGKSVKAGSRNSYQKGNPSMFLQIASSEKAVRKNVLKIINKTAQQTQSFAIASIAVLLQSKGKASSLQAVFDAIDKLISDLQAEGVKDTQDRDTCIADLAEYTEEVAKFTHEIKRNNLKIATLEKKIQKIQDTIDEKTDEQVQAEADKAASTAQRTEEKGLYATSKQDDEAAKELLEKATKTMTNYFGVQIGSLDSGRQEGALLQQPVDGTFEVSENQAPEAKFSSADSNKSPAKAIIGMLTQLIEDLTRELEQGAKMEEETQAAYEAEQKRLEDLIENLKEQIVNLNTNKTNTEAEKTDTENTKKNVNEAGKDEFETKMNGLAPLDCNEGFVGFGGYDDKTQACCKLFNRYHESKHNRNAQEEGLRAAKAALSGAVELVQTGAKAEAKKPVLLTEAIRGFLHRA